MVVDAAPATNRSGRWGSRLGVLILTVALLAGATLFATARFGAITGEEFCPQTFKRRLFYYYELPLVGWQVTPIDRDANSGDLEGHLVQQKLVPTSTGTHRWDLAWVTRGDAGKQLGDAQILCRYLSAVDDQDKQVWLEWTEKHPAIAKSLWPHVARLADLQLYALIPELFSGVRSETNAALAAQRCQTIMTTRLLEVAGYQQEMDQLQLAVELYDEVLTLEPRNLSALEGRIKSLDAQGKPELAAADREMLRNIQGPTAQP